MLKAPLEQHLQMAGFAHHTHHRVCAPHTVSPLTSNTQCASALEAPWEQHRYFINWRNAQLNGVSLEAEGLAKKLRDYSIPAAGSLKIDYITYRVRCVRARRCGCGCA